MATIEQLPATVDVTIIQGDSWTQTFIFRDSVTQDPIPIGDWDITAQIRKSSSSPTGISLDVDMTNAIDGEVTVRLTSEDSSTLRSGNRWDLQRVLDGETRTLIAGKFVVDSQVTR